MVLAVGILLACLVVGLCFYANIKRPLLSAEMDLIPNQLLTTYPVVFLSGKKSLFYFMNYWNHLPERMREHGHEVNEWNLPWRSQAQTEKELLKKLETFKGQSFHIIADSTLCDAIYFLASLDHSAIKSLNIISTDRNQLNPPHSFKPFPTPVRSYEFAEDLRAQSGWTSIFVKLHQKLTRSQHFEPRIVGSTRDQREIETFYLGILSELAMVDLTS